MRLALISGSALVAICGIVACGDDGSPAPGYLDPCGTAGAALLGCPSRAGGWDEETRSIQTACRRLVGCGLLAAERFGSGGEHLRDYAWCVARLELPGIHGVPCGGRRFSAAEVEAVIACIHDTPCLALGAPDSSKGKAAAADRYACTNGESARTATICDHGLLSY